MERENLANFRTACKQLGVKDHDIFDVNDLYKHEDIGAVVNTIHALSRTIENFPNYKGKLIKRGITTHGIPEEPTEEPKHTVPTSETKLTDSKQQQRAEIRAELRRAESRKELREELRPESHPELKRSKHQKNFKIVGSESIVTLMKHLSTMSQELEQDGALLLSVKQGHSGFLQKIVSGAVFLGGVVIGFTCTYYGYKFYKLKR